MKKIYMILAAITLLSMSLNAQVDTQTKSSANTKTPQVASFNFNDVLRNIKGMEGILSVNGPAQVTPFRYNSALYNTLGPFTGDNFDYGIGFPEAYPNGPQDILVTTVLDRNEFADHIGEEIVGFRFALYGDAAKTVKVSDFIAWPYYSQEGFDQDHLYEWTLTDLVGNTEPGGGDEPGPGGETTYQYVKITSADDLTSGQYLIVCESQNVAFNGSLAASGLSATNNQASVTITNSTIESNATTDGMAFTYDATATSLQSASGYYIGRQSGTSGGALEALSSAYAHTILFSSGVPSIRCTSTNGNNTYYLRYNSDSNCFRYYTSSSQTAIQLYKKVAVNNSKGGKKANRRANRTTVTVASSDFSSSSGWTIIDANNDGSTWSISSSGYAAYNYNQNNAANDWLVYSSIALEAGKTYTFNLDAWRRGTNYPEKLEVKFASANTATALSAGTTIIAETTVTSTSQTSPNALSNTFTVTSSGNYYIGIHATSAKDMYTLYVDNMLITTESNDPTIIASTNSVNLSATPNGTASETITVTGENLTTDITATISGTDASLFSVSPATTGGGNLTITYSPTAVGTHSATLTLSSTGAQDVTVALTGTCSTDVTICDGTVTNNYLPIYGYYYDNVQINQIIYPASLLTNLNGKKITSMTFYSPHLYFSGGKFTVKVGETSQASFSSAVRNTADLTAVVVTDMAAPTAGGTELTITFATPYEYNGGNLLFDFEVTETGSYGTSQTSFYGITQTGGGFNSNASSGSSTNSNGVYSNGTVRNFLPKVTFAVEDNGGDNNDGYVALEPGQWHEFYLDAPVTFDVEDDDDMLFMGYWYKQYPLSSSNDEVMNPAAVNSESTGHYHFVNMVAEANVAGDIVISLPGSTMNVSSITVYDSNSNEIASWNATTAFNNGQYTQVTVGSNNRYNYTLPTGWSIASGNYFLVYSGDNTNYYGYLYAAGDLTIASSALNGNTTVTVVIRGMDDNGGVTVSVNGDGKTIGTNETNYTWNNVDLTTTGYARNWYTVDFSEVGDLAVQLIFKTIKTPSPTITGEVDPNNENNYVITATGDGTVTLTVGETTVTGEGTASITIPRTDVDQTVTATATAQETGKEESDPTTEDFTVPKLVTADPVITYVVNGDNVVITATGDGTVTLTVGETTVTGDGSASITVPRTDANQTVTASATAQETGKAVSNTVTENITIPAMPQTATPTITYVVNGDNVVITATGNGTVTLTVDGQTVTGNGSASITVPRTNVDQTVTATATAQEADHLVSETATENITIPKIEVPVPTLTSPTDGETVNVGTNTGSGTSTTITVSGHDLTGDLTISVEGEGFSIETTTISAQDANAGTTITITYDGYSANATGTLTITSSNGEVEDVTVNLTANYESHPIEPVTGLLRLHMLLCDQLMANIPDDNTHADAYRYVLKYEPQSGDPKESNPVTVEIQKTECEVKGYYTKAEIDADTVGALTMGVLTADVQFDLSSDDNTIEFYDLQGRANEYPTLGHDYLTKLRQTTDFTYVEMLPGSPNEGEPYDAGEHHYYDDSEPILTGTYNSGFMSYAPSLSTWGIQRRYFEDDGLDNTYGAPIWRTRVGDVQIQGKPAMQKQVINAGTANEENNPYTTWTADGKTYCLYFLGVNAQALLPSTEGTYGTNIKYEPYMFRVFVESTSGKLRKFTRELGEGGGYYAVDAGPITGKYCVGSYDIESDTWTAEDLFFSKTIPSNSSLRAFNPNAWDDIMKFGAEDGITKDDIKVYVRFYYMVKGWNATRDGEARPGNGAEGSGDPDDPGTFVYELVSNAEVIGVTYVNAQGMTSDKPFEGLNIVVTKFSDGTTSTTKVMRKH